MEIAPTNIVYVTKELLPYFKTWYTVITEGDADVPYQNGMYEIVLDPRAYICQSLWQVIIEIYEVHYRQCTENKIDPYETPIKLGYARTEELTMDLLFTLIYVLNFYDSPLLLRTQLCEVRLTMGAYSSDELQHYFPDVPFEDYQPASYKEKIAIDYAKWNNTTRLILSYYLNNVQDLIDAILQQMPSIGPLIAHSQHTMIITNRGLFASGANDEGQLGLGDRCRRSSPENVNLDDVCSVSAASGYTIILAGQHAFRCGRIPGHIDKDWSTDALEYVQNDLWLPSPIYLNGFGGVVSVACGESHLGLVTGLGEFFVRGDNDDGQLGLGNTDGIVGLFKKVESLSNVHSAACGYLYTMVVTKDGSLYASGTNTFGQLGLGDAASRTSFTKVDISGVIHVACGKRHSMILTREARVFGSGRNVAGELGIGKTMGVDVFNKVTLENVVSVTCGPDYTMMITIEGSLFACGENGHGELGLGDYDDRAIPIRVDLLSRVLEVSCRGYSHTDKSGRPTLILTAEGLYACGLCDTDTLNTRYGTIHPLATLVSMNILSMGHEEHTSSRSVRSVKRKERDRDDDDKSKKRPRIKALCTFCTNEARYTHPDHWKYHFCSQQCYERILLL